MDADHIKLNHEEKVLLLEILGQYLDGMDEAKEAMIEDRATFLDVDTFSQTVQQHDLDVETAGSIRQKVLDATESESRR